MDFFNTIYFDNSIKNYCIVVGSILLMLIIKRTLSRYIASLLFRLTHGLWKHVEKKKFVALVLEPLEWLLLIVITVFAIDKLNFPADWQYKIYGHATDEILNKSGMGIIILVFTWFLLRIIDFIAMVLEQKALNTEGRSTGQQIVFFRDFLKVIVAILGLLLLIKACFGQPIGNLLTSLSIVGAVLALAAKESLENLIASFIIFFDKPFSPGDLLKVNTVTGIVEKIGLRSTRIRTADKTLVTVPNKQMVDSVVDNHSMRTHRRSEIKLELSPKTTAAETQQCIAEIKKLLETKKDSLETSSVYLSEISKNGLLLVIEYFTQPISIDLFNRVKEEVNMDLKKILEENNIETAVTSGTVTIINGPVSE
jgi:MscS family membrane protein